jgi:hypothetical protein
MGEIEREMAGLNVEGVLKQLTLEEKVSLTAGKVLLAK